MLSTYCKILPDVLYPSPVVPSLLRFSTMALDCTNADAIERNIWWVRDFLQSVLDENCRPNSPYFAVVKEHALAMSNEFCGIAVQASLGAGRSGLPWSGAMRRNLSSVLLYLCAVISFEVWQTHLINALGLLDETKASAAVKTQFMELCQRFV